MSEEFLEDPVTTFLCTREQACSAVKLIAARHINCPVQCEIASTKMLEILLGEKTTAEASSRSIVSEELLNRYVSDAIFFLKWIIDGLDRITTPGAPPGGMLRIQYVSSHGRAAIVLEPPIGNGVSLQQAGNSSALTDGAARSHCQDASLDSPRLHNLATSKRPLTSREVDIPSMPPIEGLSKELRVEILAWLDRMSIERSMAVSRRFRSAANALMLTGPVPLRILPLITFSCEALFQYVGARAFRWTKMEELRVFGHDLITPVPISTRELDGLLDALSTTIVERLLFNRLSFCPLSPADLAKLLRLDGLRALGFSRCCMLSAHFDNAFLSNFPVNGETRLFLEDNILCDRNEFALNDEGVLQYMFASGSNGMRWLQLHNVNASDDLPRKILEMKTRREGARVDSRFRLFASQQKLTEHRRILDTTGLRCREREKAVFYRSDDATIRFSIKKNLSHPYLNCTLKFQ